MPRLRRAAHPLSAPGVGRGRGCPGLRRPGQAEPPRATGGTRTRTRSPPAPAARSPLPVPSCSGGAGWLSVGSGFSCACVLAQSPASGLRMLPGFVPLLLPLGSSFFFFFCLAECADRFKVAEGAPSLSSLSKKRNFVPNFSSVQLL